MKKIVLLLVVLLAFSVSSSFAAYVVYSSTTAGFLTLNTGGMDAASKANMSDIGLSPKVEAYYVTDGTTDVSAQWYAISTLHPGGTLAYGTAQDLNNIYHSDYQTGSDAATELKAIPTSSASNSVWDVWGDI